VASRRNLFIGAGIILVFHLIYYPTWNAGFVTDFTGLLARLEHQSAWGILYCFGFPALEQVLNAFLFVFYKLFGASPLPWYLIHTSLHLLNAYLCFLLVKQLIRSSHFAPSAADGIALAGALLFLFSPYQSEVVTWRVCFNFLCSTFLILSSLLYLLRWIEQEKSRDFWILQCCFLLGLFTFELSLMLPFMGLGLYLLFSSAIKKAAKVFVPQFALLGIYFLLNRLVLGQWIGHYGAETHLRFPLREMLNNFINYSIKLLGFVRYYEHSWKEYLFGLVNQAIYFYGMLLFITLCLGLLIRAAVKGHHKARLIIALGLLYALALAPVINLHFNYLLHIENDRYNYLASAFFYPFLILLIHYLPRYLFWGVNLLFLLCSLYFVQLTNGHWKASTAVYHSLLDTFEVDDAPAVLLLNLPDNLNGAVMFRDYSKGNRAFRDALYYLKGKSCPATIYEVAQYNMTRPANGATLSRQDASPTVFKVEFNQWGNWWWNNGIGLGPGYETPQFELSNHGHHYTLSLRHLPEGSVLLVQDGGHWKKYRSDGSSY
jgi:hypothetical protein